MPVLTHGRLAPPDSSRALQLYEFPVVPGIIERRSLSSAVLTFVSCGLYAFIWLRALRNEYCLALTRDPEDGSEKALFALCSCGLAAFPVLAQMDAHAMRLLGRAPRASLIWLAFVPIVGFGLALHLVQNALNELESAARKRHGHHAIDP